MEKRYKIALVFYLIIITINLVDAYNTKQAMDMNQRLLEDVELREKYVEAQREWIKESGGELNPIQKAVMENNSFWKARIITWVLAFPFLLGVAYFVKKEETVLRFFVFLTGWYAGLVSYMLIVNIHDYLLFLEVLK